jgi:hypothetical protein
MVPVSELLAGLDALDGAPLDTGLLAGRTVLVVNVASKCGLTPQFRRRRAGRRARPRHNRSVVIVNAEFDQGVVLGNWRAIATFWSRLVTLNARSVRAQRLDRLGEGAIHY